jgi:hypothetical protein
MLQEKGEFSHSHNPKKKKYVYLDKFETFKLSVEKWQKDNGNKKRGDLLPLIISAIASAIACVALWYAAHP